MFSEFISAYLGNPKSPQIHVRGDFREWPSKREQTELTGRPKYMTPSYDPIVVTALCTMIALEERILEIVEAITRSKPSSDSREDWVVPDITWVNGVRGCGNTTWVVKHFEIGRDVVITTTLEAARVLREKLDSQLGADAISKIVSLCPPEIEVACHNGPESSTISGPADVMRAFVQELTAKGIFAKEVSCSNIAYHSRYIAKAGPDLLNHLKEVIKDPKPRSQKWVSTSVPRDKWDEPEAKYSSAEYHTNNLLRSVLFEETSRLIPNNAVVIEIAPHGLLQAILKRSLGPNCVHIPLTRRGHSDSVTFLLNNIGQLYQAGLTPQIQALYPQISFPVSTGTPMLSHLVEWMHSEKWYLCS
ncbi:Fatty acid synthase [Eumeta japonica]|uniref:Fatty acid synthase n=1 Tax=Eumeta variegata TaxID=151549 RepID=A0A4C1WNU1_EUMVA|nr:Fatty acid synthase [Eumeta japonica]